MGRSLTELTILDRIASNYMKWMIKGDHPCKQIKQA